LFAVVLPLVPPPSSEPDTLWAVDSPYNLVRIVRNGPWLLLKLNDEDGVHSIRNERSAFTGHYYDAFALGPLINPAKHMLVLGMGGGSSIATARITAPGVEVDAVEIDPAVIEAAVRFFGVDPNDAGLHIHIADARRWLARNRDRYDLVQVDLYRGDRISRSTSRLANFLRRFAHI
jgi:spermidine synthase